MRLILRFRTAAILLVFGAGSVVSSLYYGPADASGVWQDPGLVRRVGVVSLVLGALALVARLLRSTIEWGARDEDTRRD